MLGVTAGGGGGGGARAPVPPPGWIRPCNKTVKRIWLKRLFIFISPSSAKFLNDGIESICLQIPRMETSEVRQKQFKETGQLNVVFSQT